MEILFFIAAFLSLYSYFLYPVLLKVLPSRRSDSGQNNGNANLPSLSLIITVHNEEGRIREKLENTLQIDYPSDLLEIISSIGFFY